MAAELTQDALLRFLQSGGGSARNADLLLHFRGFIRDHADRERNRELFKKFVNSLATVQQVDGVSYVVLRKKFRGHVSGGRDGGSSGSREPPAGGEPSSAVSSEKPRQKLPQREVTTAAAQGGSRGKSVLPAAGILPSYNNNNLETNLNVKQKEHGAELCGRQSPEKTGAQTISLSDPLAQDPLTKPPGISPVLAAVTPPAGTSQRLPAPENLRGREACQQPGRGLHQEPPLHHVSPPPRRIRQRQSYKSAISYDDDEEEEVPVRRGAACGARPLSAPLGDEGGAASASLPCIAEPPAPEHKLPKLCVQGVEGVGLPPAGSGWGMASGGGLRGQRTGTRLESGSCVGDLSSTRRSPPSEAESQVQPPPGRAAGTEPHRGYQPAGVQLHPTKGLDASQRVWLSSSQSSIFSPPPDTGPPRGLGWQSSTEDLRVRAGKMVDGCKMQQAQSTACPPVAGRADRSLAPWHHSTGHLNDGLQPTAHLSPFRHSTDHLHDDRGSTARVLPWHLSTDDLRDNHEAAESSEGSASSPPQRQRPAAARRLGSQLRSRMCRSLGADLDLLLQEEARGGAGGGSEAARLNRLHLISSSLSLRYNLSSSSMSSCSTPPRCHSLAELAEGAEGKGGRRSLPAALPSAAQHEGPSRQSLVPLEPREHEWVVKSAAGAWPDIYSLFREDPSLLNRRDFISGFTVLHWIAKHGDHRVLNTLWYGVQKAGLTFDINARSTCGHTPLHVAAIHSNKNIMRLLVNKFSADVRLRDTTGKKPWQYLSCSTSPDLLQLLGAPAGGGDGGAATVDPSWKQQQQRRRRRHHFSSASSGERPLTISGTARVKRSSSIAAFLKHKSLRRFHGHQSDSSI